MAKNDNLTDFITDVADAIRYKKNTTDKINPQDFSSEIRDIWADGSVVINQEKSIEVIGGNSVDVFPDSGYTGLGKVSITAKNGNILTKDVNFYDYDGTLLYSYSKDEFLNYGTMPTLPTREGLICQEWNYTYDEVVDCCNRCGECIVGATYITDDGKTRMYVRINSLNKYQNRVNFTIYKNRNNDAGLVVNWGDGTEETFTKNTYFSPSHSYTETGDYIISLEAKDKNGYQLYFLNDNRNEVYKLELGAYVHGVVAHYGNFREINLPKGYTPIAFNDFASNLIQSIVIPNGCTTVATDSFIYNPLRFISLPMSVTELGDINSTRTCMISTLIIPNSSTNLNIKLLPECKKVITSANFAGYSDGISYHLEELILTDDVTYIEGISSYVLRKLILSNNLQSIGSVNYDTLEHSEALQRIDYPKSLRNIKKEYSFGTAQIHRIHNFTEHEVVPVKEAALDYDCDIVVPSELFDKWIEKWKVASLFHKRAFKTNLIPEICTQLSISAVDVSAEQTNTTIIVNAIASGRRITDGEYVEDVVYRTCDTSARFEANTSTEPIIREITYTLLGVTATTTITQAGVVETTTES